MAKVSCKTKDNQNVHLGKPWILEAEAVVRAMTSQPKMSPKVAPGLRGLSCFGCWGLGVLGGFEFGAAGFRAV